MLEITIKTLDGRDSLFSVEDETKVEDFKVDVEAKLGIPVAQQRLIFQGRLLEDSAKLSECGVDKKVIHLVRRPPPSTQADTQPGSTPSSGGHTTVPVGGVTWGGIDMQQAIQDITAGIFSGLGEIGRNVHFPPHPSGEPPGGPRVPASAILARERTFNRLYRQATHLLQRIAQHPLFPGLECTSDSSVNDATPTESPPERSNTTIPASPLVEHSGAEPSRKTGTTDRESSSRPGSPMTIDSDPESHTEAAGNSTTDDTNEETSNRQSHSETATTSDTTAERPISVLADMISRHRRLWRSAEPYLDRWEAMLNAESRAQEELVNSEQSDQEVKPMEPTSSAEAVEPGARLVKRTDSPPLLTTQVVPAESGEPNTGDWHHRFFLQISRLLHLHAHMLHLISDFNVISIANASQESRDGQSESIANPVPASQPVDTTTHNAGVAIQSVPTTTTDTAHPGVEQQEPVRSTDNRRRRRVLRVPETEAHLIRARINIEPVLEPVALRPPGEGRPVPEGVLRGRPTLTPVFDRRRSQSASGTLRRSSDGTLIQVTVPGSTPRSTEIPAISTSVHTAPLSTGGAAIIHRVDIPIISMNMLNLPIPAMFEHVITATPTTSSQSSGPVVTTTSSNSDSVSNSTTTTTTSSTDTTTTAAPQPSESVGSEAGREPDTIPPPSQPVAPPHHTGLPHGPTDPFLVCHSRHFAHDAHFRRSAMGGSFGIPLTFPPSVQLIPAGLPSMRVTEVTPASSQPTTTPSSERSSTISQANTEMRPPTSAANEPQVRTSRPEGGSTFSIPSALSQQIAGFISAATNAATSAVTMGGGPDMGPFNMFLSSSPMQFTVTANRSTPRTTSGTTTSASTPQVTTTTSVGGRGVPPGDQPFSWLFGGENPLLPAMSVASSLLQSLQQGSPQPAPSSATSQTRASSPPRAPTGATTSESESSSPSRLDGVNLLVNEVIQAFVDIVWDRLRVLASEHDASFIDCASEPSAPTASLHPRDLRIAVRFLTDVISTFQAALPPVDETAPFTASSLHTLQMPLDNIIYQAESAICDSMSSFVSPNFSVDPTPKLVDMITELVFDGRISDGRGSCTPVEATGHSWVTKTGGTVDQVVDIRASLAQLFKFNLKMLVELKQTPGNSLYGTVLLRILTYTFVDSLCLLDILVAELAQYTGVPYRLQAAGEHDFNGFNRVRDFLNSGPPATQQWATQMQRAFDACFARYRAMNSADLQRKWAEVRRNFLVFRRVPIKRFTVPLDDDDVPLDDPPFVDACSELPPPDNNLDHFNGGAQPHQLISPVDSLPQSVKPGTQSPSEVSPLPDWTPKPNELPDPWTRGLDPHPDSARAMMHVPNPEGWHAVLPAEWVGVVARDVSTMTQSTNGEVRSPQSFSDAYISGMPAKRRKVMQENARSVAKPPSAFLTDCLSDAIRVSGCEPNPTDDSANATTVTTAPVAQTGAATPGRDLNLSVSLKEFVSEEIAKRLSTDPDFDPVQFPISNELFVKKAHPNN